jgi:hypothetical protein
MGHIEPQDDFAAVVPHPYLRIPVKVISHSG